MATSKNAKLQFESGQSVTDYTVMTDSGDHKVHTVSGGTVWSGKSGYEPAVRPNGVVTGRNIVSTHASNDTVTIAAFTAYSGGTLYEVDATTASITRADTDVGQIHSITMNSSGSITVVEGEDSATSALSETRGAAGGPPSIPDDSVEIAQVRLTGNTAAVITADEIFQTVGTHHERFDYPAWTENNIGDGDKASVSAKKNAYIEFDSALPMIHGDTATDAADDYKKVYIRYYEPTMADAQKAMDFTPCENTHSISSTEVYGNKTVGSSSKSLGQGGFTAMLSDGVTDSLLAEQDEVVTVKFFPDRNKTAYVLTQGTLGVSRTYPTGDQNQAECTITAETASAGFAS